MFSIISGIFWLVMLFIWLGFMSTVKQRLAALEDLARRQTAALERIARHLAPPTAEKPPGCAADRYITEQPKSHGQVLLAVIGAAFVLLLVAVALSKK